MTQIFASFQRLRRRTKPATSAPLTQSPGPGRHGSTRTCQTSCIRRFGRPARERWTRTILIGSWTPSPPLCPSAQKAKRRSSRVRGVPSVMNTLRNRQWLKQQLPRRVVLAKYAHSGIDTRQLRSQPFITLMARRATGSCGDAAPAASAIEGLNEGASRTRGVSPMRAMRALEPRRASRLAATSSVDD